MLYLILTIVFLVLVWVISFEVEDDSFFVTLIGLIFLVAAIYCGYKSYQSIKSPIYVEKEVENSELPLIDTKMNNNGKYDKAYIDDEKLILYIDKKVYDQGKVTIVEEDTVPRIVVKKYVPKFTYNSVNVYFNQKIEYIIYVPEEYEINTLLNF